ncbi:MAG: site-specific DNA-methyltransferase [Verrucomicrobia bacterium]|nr:MAG: site-specific DNA-methyltransferase [Verrucomicrobiota bacterium]
MPDKPKSIRLEAYKLEVKDCVKGMLELPDEYVDVVVTSPPYNLGIKYESYRDSRTRNDYLNWSRDWSRQVRRVLKDNGSFFLNLGSAPSNPLIPHELVGTLKEVGFILQNTFHWIKSITVQTKEGKMISTGHFKPLHSRRFVNDCHEYVFHLTKHGDTPLDRLAIGVPYSDKSNIKRWAHTEGKDLRCRGNNWFIPYKTIVSRSKQRPHPATFPVELAEFCIKVHGAKPELVVMDPFLGIGHSALAAKNCGIREFIGFDIESSYLKVARTALLRGTTAPGVEIRGQEGQKKNDFAGTLFDASAKQSK